MSTVRGCLFTLGCFECWACGVNTGLHYWQDVAGEVLAALIFFGLFFAIPHIRAFLAADQAEGG